jgi:hypothetical protein
VSTRAAGALAGLLVAWTTWCGPAAAAQDRSEAGTPDVPPGPAAPARPGREVSLPESEVKDTFFAYFLGIISGGMPVDMDNAQMREILVEFKSALDVPFDLITRVTQRSDAETGDRIIGLEFARDVVVPVPFSLLFYHPGSIIVSRWISFEVRRSAWTDPVAGGESATAFDLVLSRGTVLVDIDDWLEALLRDHLEDTWIRQIVFFRWGSDWIAMMAGKGRGSGRTKRAYFDLTRNRILFPASDSLTAAGRTFYPD